MNAAGIMSTALATLGPENTVAEALAVFLEKKTPCIAVMDEEKRVVGVVTPALLMRRIFSQERLPVFTKSIGELNKPLKGFVEGREIESVAPETTAAEIAEKFTDPATDIVVVVDNGKRPLGVISPVDVFRALLRFLEKTR
jgi:CBS-domain-containing membrane protein